jgi:hypothetical protein
MGDGAMANVHAPPAAPDSGAWSTTARLNWVDRVLDALAERARRGPLTLVFGARDTEHNQAVVIADELERRWAGVGGRIRRASRGRSSAGTPHGTTD